MTTDPKKNDEIKDEELDKVSGGTGGTADEQLGGIGGPEGGTDPGSGGTRPTLFTSKPEQK